MSQQIGRSRRAPSATIPEENPLRLPRSARALLRAMRDRHARYLTLEQAAAILGRTYQTARRAVNALEAAGAVTTRLNGPRRMTIALVGADRPHKNDQTRRASPRPPARDLKIKLKSQDGIATGAEASSLRLKITKTTGMLPRTAASLVRSVPAAVLREQLAALPFRPAVRCRRVRELPAYFWRCAASNFTPPEIYRLRRQNAALAVECSPPPPAESDAAWFDRQSDFLRRFFTDHAAGAVGTEPAALRAEILRRVALYRADRKATLTDESEKKPCSLRKLKPSPMPSSPISRPPSCAPEAG